MNFKIMLVILSVLVLSISTNILAKEFDFSITSGVSYDKGKWESMEKIDYPLSFSGQIKFTRWDFKPTLDVSYRKMKFDFSTLKSPVQEANPWHLSIRTGLTKDFKWFEGYAVAGVSFIKNNAKLIEIVETEQPRIRCLPPIKRKVFKNHGKHDTWDNQFSGKIGAYRLFGNKLKIGPEIACEIYSRKPGFERCREFHTLQFVPQMGIRIQF